MKPYEEKCIISTARYFIFKTFWYSMSLKWFSSTKSNTIKFKSHNFSTKMFFELSENGINKGCKLQCLYLLGNNESYLTTTILKKFQKLLLKLKYKNED